MGVQSFGTHTCEICSHYHPERAVRTVLPVREGAKDPARTQLNFSGLAFHGYRPLGLDR
jgi:hypothetical protein